jgi:hypothetical protein
MEACASAHYWGRQPAKAAVGVRRGKPLRTFEAAVPINQLC